MAQAIVDAVKELGQEEQFLCVQCGARFSESTNGEGACMFHTETSNSWNRGKHGCCGGTTACKKSKHRAAHHCDYPYGKFFEMVSSIMCYCDTHDSWVEATDLDLETGKEEKVVVAKMLRWATRAALITENLLLVKVGQVSSDSKYWFKVYSEAELDEIGKAGKTEIFRNSESSEEYALARWIISDSIVTGIHVEAKSKTSERPYAYVVNFSPFPLEKGEVKVLSEGGIIEAKPAEPYNLPGVLEIGQKISEEKSRKPRTNFPTQGNLKVKIKAGDLAANERHQEGRDVFRGFVTLMNLDKTEPLVIVETKCEWRLVGNPEWNPISDFVIENNTPFTCDPLQPVQIYFTASIEVPEKKVRWFDRAWVARRQPLRLRVTFEDVSGGQCSQVIEYCFNPWRLEAPSDDDLLFLKADDPDAWERNYVKVQKGYDIISVGSNSYKLEDLRKIVYKASKEGESEQLLCEQNNWKAWALVDFNCKRVYAIKAIVWSPVSAAVGYAPVELYGKVDEVKENKVALEKNTLPDIETDPGVEYPQDDDLDDKLIALPAAQSSSGGSAQGVVQFDQGSLAVLNAVNENLKRMADSMEKLDSMEKSMVRLAEAFEGLTKVLSEKK